MPCIVPVQIKLGEEVYTACSQGHRKGLILLDRELGSSLLPMAATTKINIMHKM